MPPPTIDELLLAEDPERWARLGFEIDRGLCLLGNIRLRFRGADRERGQHPAGDREPRSLAASREHGIVEWSLRDVESLQLDGLPSVRSQTPSPGRDAETPPAPTHPNGALAIDHLVAISPDLDRTVGTLRGAGLPLRRIREQPTPAGAPRQAFFRLGGEILEVIQEPAEVLERAGGRDRPTRFWGLAVRVGDLQATAAALGEALGEIRPAVQAGRQIATLRRSAGIGLPLAFMSAPR